MSHRRTVVFHKFQVGDNSNFLAGVKISFMLLNEHSHTAVDTALHTFGFEVPQALHVPPPGWHDSSPSGLLQMTVFVHTVSELPLTDLLTGGGRN
jgi:hypothetical protein